MLNIFHSVSCHSTVMMRVIKLLLDYEGACLMYISVEGSEY